MSAGEGGMSPAAARVKKEPEWDDIEIKIECGASKAAAASSYAEHEVKRELMLGPEQLQPASLSHILLPTVVRVKEEPEWDNPGAYSECGASEAAAASLYAEHEVKGELVLGPECTQPQDTPHGYYAYTIPLSFLGAEWCSVKQEPTAAGPGDAPRSGKGCKEQLALRTCSDKKLYACTFCHKTFLRECSLKTHLRIHSAEGTSSNVIQSRKKIKVRKRKKTYPCDYCGKRFRLNSYLTMHIRIHTGEKPFKCNVCTKQFSRNEHLTNHMFSHTGEKPFKCNMCKKQFSRNHHLARHVQIHLGEKEKPFSCNICKRFFSQKVNSNTHKCNAAPRPRFDRRT